MTDVEEFAEENTEMLKRVLRHSSDEFARASAWTILDRGLDDPEIEQLERELEQVKSDRGMA